MWQAITFAVITMYLVVVSRESLRAPRSHGFYRFFAWEGLVLQILLNVPFWFDDPLSVVHFAAWVLLFGSIVPLVLGLRELGVRGRPVPEQRQDPSLLAFERTSALVTTGIFRYIRHPMYSSLLMLNWGAYLKEPTLASTLLALVVSAFLLATARADEAECTAVFGPAYAAYRSKTKMFIPKVV